MMQFLIHRLACYSFLLFFLIYACAQTPEEKTKSKPVVSLKDLEKEITQLAADPLLRTGDFTFSMKSARTGQTLLEHNTQKSVLVASNMKIVTTATALAVLGEDYTFTTELQHDGTLNENGVLNGNIYIKGGGDPSLGSTRVQGSLSLQDIMTLWATQIRQFGITQVNGAVVGDASAYNDNIIPGNWVWSDIGNYYGAGAYGLNINENLYCLHFKPGSKVGSPALILRTEPLMKEIVFVNEVTTGPVGSGDNAYIYGAPYTNLRYVQGTVPAGVKTFSIKGAIPDPVTFTAEQLSQTLVKQGIRIKNPATSTRFMQQPKKPDTERKSVYVHISPPLKYIVEQTNLQSINLFAEAILKVLAIQKHENGTTFSGTEAVVDFWKGKNVNTEGFFMRDGSGLSRTNVITTSTLNEILHWCTAQPFFPSLLASLPVAGVSGTMRNTGRGTPAAGKIFAKTGTVERVMSYAGYFRTQSGELVSFVMVTNNYTGESREVKRKVEKLMSLMSQLP